MNLVILNHLYKFDPSKPRLLKRGLIDIYEMSPEVDEWVVINSYIMWSAVLQKPIVIPRWFKTDLSSIPKRLRWLVSVNERHRLASLPHDLLYVLSTWGKYTYPRKKADQVLLEFCELMGVPYWKRYLIYGSVRMGGFFCYKGNVKPIFIPTEHRVKYQKAFPRLELNIGDGEYLNLIERNANGS